MEQLSFFSEEPGERDALNALSDLFQNIQAYQSSRAYFELLQFVGRFTRYSPYNCCLLYIQNPKVSFVATARKWARKFQRFLLPTARPLLILAPKGPVMFVYDLADTEGAPLPERLLNPFGTGGRLPEQVWTDTLSRAAEDEIAVMPADLSQFQAGSARRHHGTAYSSQRRERFTFEFLITYNQQLPLEACYATLVHELGHIYCGHLGKTEASWWRDRKGRQDAIEELEAESVSYLVCKRRGLQTKSEEYLSLHTAQDQGLPEISLDLIIKVSSYIEAMSKAPRPGQF